MCGIIGVASKTSVDDRRWLKLGRDSMRHRGPDDAGEWWAEDGSVGFAHRRLAIIDLSPAGHQPMHDTAGELCIVFNGEIYNHSELRDALKAVGHIFRSNSDTEVILAAYREWAADCLDHFNGMFSFAIYDSKNRHVFLARDRAGEKPLFYTLANGALRFSSELKGLLGDPSLPRVIDQEALDCFLAMGYVPGERCMLRGVKKLPPAHAMLFNLQHGDTRLWRYWSLPALSARQGCGQDEIALLDELESLLADSVGKQLVADVPVGVLLSGGLDSSLITAMAVRNDRKVKTFTVRFPGAGHYDETEHARLIARHFGTEHVELDGGEASVELLPLLARQFDEPMVDSSMIPTFLVSRMIRQHCTVALGGDGGDELFGGYRHYDRLLWLQHKMRHVPGWLRRYAATGAEWLLPVGVKGRNWLQGLDFDLQSGLPLIASCYDRSTRKKLMAGQENWMPVAEEIRRKRIPAGNDLLQRATRMDFENYLAEDILVKVDRASMLTSLEVRAPFLDYRLIEFAFGRVPSALKTTANQRKILLKKLAGRLLPPEFDQARKQGFSIPLASWLSKGVWKDYFNEILLDPGSTVFDRKTVASLLAGQAKGRANSERLYALVMFELWRREYRISI